MPPLTKEADERDLQLAKKLVEIFAKEYDIKVPAETIQQSVLERLEFYVRFLWKVFGYSFYTGVRCDDEHSLSLKSVRYERGEGM